MGGHSVSELATAFQTKPTGNTKASVQRPEPAASMKAAGPTRQCRPARDQQRPTNPHNVLGPQSLGRQAYVRPLHLPPPSLCRPWTEASRSAISKPFSAYSGAGCEIKLDTYLCTDCYVWDDAVERKADMSTVWPAGPSARPAGEGREVSHPLKKRAIIVLGDPPSLLPRGPTP